MVDPHCSAHLIKWVAFLTAKSPAKIELLFQVLTNHIVCIIYGSIVFLYTIEFIESMDKYFMYLNFMLKKIVKLEK